MGVVLFRTFNLGLAIVLAPLKTEEGDKVSFLVKDNIVEREVIRVDVAHLV